jgi:NTE family protein
MKYKNLILSGGGTRGIYYLGLMKYFENYGINTSDFKNLVGSSIGSFFISAIALGYSSEELKEYAISILDYSRLKSLNILNFLDNLGFDEGDKLEHNIKRMIRNKIGNKSITLLELYEKYDKNLTIPTVCLSTRELIFLNKDTHPHVKLWKAIRMSLGVPFLFKPFLYKGNYYIDGGLKNNFPIDLYNTIDTLGVCITSKKKEHNSFFNLEKLVISLIDIVTTNDYSRATQDIIEISDSYSINDELLSFQPNLEENTIVKSIEYGYDKVENYFKNRENSIESFCKSLVLHLLDSITT